MNSTNYKPWEHFTDEDFFRVLDSEAYQRRFRGQGSPLYRQNGGLEFHNPETLRQRIEDAERDLHRYPGARNQWIIQNRIRATRSWLQQVEWIIDRLERYKDA